MVPISAASFALGVLCHLTIFIRGEWHLRVHTVIIGHLIAAALLFFAHFFCLPGQVYVNLQRVAIIGSLYLLGLYSSIVTYRTVFSPLRRFPGPPLAAVTKLYHVWKCGGLKNYLVLDDWYHRYGQVVRIGPNEVAVFHPGAIEALDGAGQNLHSSAWYDLVRPMSSNIFARNPAEHSEKSKVWTKALTSSAIKDYMPRIRRQIDGLENLINSYHGGPTPLNDVMAWFAFDSMGEFAFNESFNMMRSKKYHTAIVQQNAAMSFLGWINSAVWLVRFAFVFLPFLPTVKGWFRMVDFCKARIRARTEQVSAEPDIAAWFIEEFQNSTVDRDRAQRQDLLDGNAITVVVGGSMTNASTLTMLFYFLAIYSEHTENLYKEIAACTDPTDADVLAGLPILNGIINESMRLLPAGLTVGWRDAGPNGIWIDDIFIPANTTIVAPRYTIFRLSSIFDRPDEFVPERWYSMPEMVKDKRGFLPFGIGKRGCVGRNLALAQIRLVVATLLVRYRVALAVEETGEAIWRDMKDQVAALPGPCKIRFIHR